MATFQFPHWTPALSVGNDEIDGQHRDFLDKLERVSRLVVEGGSKEIGEAATVMVVLLKIHFETEERIFGGTAYPKAQEHAVEHRVLLHLACHAKKMIDESEDHTYCRLSLRYLAQSMLEHLLETDMGYRRYLSESGA